VPRGGSGEAPALTGGAAAPSEAAASAVLGRPVFWNLDSMLREPVR
jgi:hypothetical protein